MRGTVTYDEVVHARCLGVFKFLPASQSAHELLPPKARQGIMVFHLLSLVQSLDHIRLALRASPLQPLLQLLLTRRRHEHIPRLNVALLELLHPFHLNVQDHDLPFRGLVPHRLLARAVPVATELRVLDEAVLGNQPLKVVAGHKVVVHAVRLARARLARRVADGQGEGVGVALAEEVEEGAFADARGAGNNDGAAVGGEVGGGHDGGGGGEGSTEGDGDGGGGGMKLQEGCDEGLRGCWG